MPEFLIVVKVDTNDADYAINTEEASREQVTKLAAVLDVVKREHHDHNWPRREDDDEETPESLYKEKGLLTQEEIDLIDEYIPHTDYPLRDVYKRQTLHRVCERK